ncbi:MAG: hypothetical protein AAF298_12415 [Cyanobacteria bacterium P01_A01_bin.40]
MWKLYLQQLSKKQAKQETGFFTLEILVSLLIAMTFVLVALQSMVYATMLKVQAQERQRANQLIKEEIERVNALASNIAEDHANKCDPGTYANGYAQDLWNVVQTYTNPPTSSNPPPIEFLFQETQADGTIAESGRQYGLNRVHVSRNITDADANANAPYRTLQIGYEVREWDGNQFMGNAIADTYIEVIPDVALSCP